MERAFFSDYLVNFLTQSDNEILGILARNNPFSLDDLQKNAWLEEIRILKQELKLFSGGYLALEYSVPRIGSRLDAVFIYRGLAFLLEFKVGAHAYHNSAIDQVIDYALDLKNFHKASHSRLLVPMLIATNGPPVPYTLDFLKDGIINVAKCNQNNIHDIIQAASDAFQRESFNPDDWIFSQYSPTPTIIEAAQALYRGHSVDEISRNDASAYNLKITTQAINQIIERCKQTHQKAICFITGVPGAGKTLAGLNIANERQHFDENEHTVFLSGNQPLVDVLQEALARDEKKRLNTRKAEAKAKAKAFIQIIHHFRDNAIVTPEAPHEKVAIFDEAQRAWTAPMLSNFMMRKKGIPNFLTSEPEFLISIMDRHKDWAVIICLVGGGQEINTGEAGLSEWFVALREKYPHWNVFGSDKITDSEYTQGLSLDRFLDGIDYSVVPELHLSVSIRSFRNEKVSAFVKALLDCEIHKASHLLDSIKHDYPIVLTRDIKKAKAWVRSQASGTERFGLTASSGAKRLRTDGIWVQNKVDAALWFLNDKDDVRSSYHLEEVATEFDIQGLELDFTIVCWGANFRFSENAFRYWQFTGTKWSKIHKKENSLFLKNAYRVLLTRARQGMVIYLPEGDFQDRTRLPSFYNETYLYLKEIGLEEI